MGVVHAKEPNSVRDSTAHIPNMSKRRQDAQTDSSSHGRRNVDGKQKRADSQDSIDLAKVKTRVDRIHVDGLGRTKDDVIKTLVTSLFKSRNFVDLVQEVHLVHGKLTKLGSFNNIQVLIDTSSGPGATPEGVEVTFFVKESGRLVGGVETSVGNNDGCVTVGLKAPNMFGRGERLECQYSYGMKKVTDVQMSVAKPIVDSRFNRLITSNIFATSNSYPWSSFNQRDIGFLFDIALSPPLSKLKHNFQYEACARNITCMKQGSFRVREECGPTLKSALKYLFTVDRRNGTVFPTEGNFLQFSTEVAGLGGNIGFVKNELSLQSNWSPLDFLTFQLGFQTGLLRDIGKDSKITIADRFFLGGPLNLRGFGTRGCAPRDNGSSLGADMYWALGLHVYTPLPFRPRRGICDLFRLHGFINAGELTNFTYKFSNSYEENLRIFTRNLRCALGGGLAINLGNYARIELNMSMPLKFLRTDVLERFQWGFGIHYL